MSHNTPREYSRGVLRAVIAPKCRRAKVHDATHLAGSIAETLTRVLARRSAVNWGKRRLLKAPQETKVATYSVYHLMRVSPAGARQSDPGEGGAHWRDTTWQPRADIYQSDDTILIHVEAPGLQLENVQLYHEPGRLVIEGVRERLLCDQGCRCLQMEIEHGAFRRVLPLPLEVDENAIEARLENGILEIVVPRRAATAAPKRIDVK